MESTKSHGNSPWRSPWVIGWVGLLVSVLAVNLAMVYFAMDSNPGLVVEDYYERGQHYERHMLDKMARDPGWSMHIDVPGDIRAGSTSTVRFSLVDKAGQPLDPEQVTFFAYRPSDVDRDFSVPMSREGAGRFRADIALPLIGVWDVLVSVRQRGEEYNVGQRIEVAGP